eukprot:TRINITY_DN11114_c0_g2_i5.p1 TRINITY_DN11114_c0_g2~~TRINITY_DN11114_c0_g2_i5.p1  ORF type:complete len:339 (-),score=42.88 TRINITY_DN11114_c0_g2_i5:538-1554(-)
MENVDVDPRFNIHIKDPEFQTFRRAHRSQMLRLCGFVRDHHEADDSSKRADLNRSSDSLNEGRPVKSSKSGDKVSRRMNSSIENHEQPNISTSPVSLGNVNSRDDGKPNPPAIVIQERLLLTIRAGRFEELSLRGVWNFSKEMQSLQLFRVEWAGINAASLVKFRSSVDIRRTINLSDIKPDYLLEYSINPDSIKNERLPLAVRAKEEVNLGISNLLINFRSTEKLYKVEVTVWKKKGVKDFLADNMSSSPPLTSFSRERVTWRTASLLARTEGRLMLQIKDTDREMIERLSVSFFKEGLQFSELLPIIKEIDAQKETTTRAFTSQASLNAEYIIFLS